MRSVGQAKLSAFGVEPERVCAVALEAPCLVGPTDASVAFTYPSCISQSAGARLLPRSAVAVIDLGFPL
jgi:hypothetical protein